MRNRPSRNYPILAERIGERDRVEDLLQSDSKMAPILLFVSHHGGIANPPCQPIPLACVTDARGRKGRRLVDHKLTVSYSLTFHVHKVTETPRENPRLDVN